MEAGVTRVAAAEITAIAISKYQTIPSSAAVNVWLLRTA